MVMAVMKTAALETDVKKLLDFVPLMNAWSIVARHEMAYFAYVTFPFKHIIAGIASLTASKAQSDHLAKMNKVSHFPLCIK